MLEREMIDVVSVQVARPSVLIRWPTRDVLSAIDKRPVAAPSLYLGFINLEGDEQADTRPSSSGVGQVHGGPDQAVYAFPAEHYPAFERELGRPCAPGLVGENLTIRGATEAEACIGDVWAWGDALLQVTSPRGPCFKLGIRLGRQALRRWVREAGFVGWYLRVLRPGSVPTAGPIAVAERHPAGVSVLAVHRAPQDSAVGPRSILELEPLAGKLRRELSAERDVSGGGGIPERDD